MVAAMAEHSKYCAKHGQVCQDCQQLLDCRACRIHGGTQLWDLRCDSCGQWRAYETYSYLLKSEVPAPPTYDKASHVFATPRGNSAMMFFRKNTNDWNTIYASMTEDEYGLAKLPVLTGVAIDIGAYVGSVGIALALDNHGLKVVCVEPVQENVDLIQRNIVANGLTDRVICLSAAAGGLGDRETTVDWGYIGEPHLEHHAFVGNTTLVYEYGSNPTYSHQETVAECYSLTDLLNCYSRDGGFSLLKIDCEGCEWRVLADPATDGINIIAGEWHNMKVSGQQPGHDALRALLPNHNVTFTGPELGPGGFTAVHK